MIDSLEPELSWTDHYVKYGFAISRGLVDRAFCDEALQEIERLVDNKIPVEEWTTENTPIWHKPFYQGANSPNPVLDKLFEQPRLVAAIDELFGGSEQWNRERNYYIFLRPYNPDAEAKIAPRGHIDFPSQFVPALYRGFTFQVALQDTEPFSGNLSLYPGTHKVVQKAVIDNPQLEWTSGQADLPSTEPFEFVARAGDVVWMHHLVFHSGNVSHSANHVSRIGLHGEAFRDEWLQSIDPDETNLSPWQQSLAHNGAFRTDAELEKRSRERRADFLEKLKQEA